jgi:hypothetical protein
VSPVGVRRSPALIASCRVMIVERLLGSRVGRAESVADKRVAEGQGPEDRPPNTPVQKPGLPAGGTRKTIPLTIRSELTACRVISHSSTSAFPFWFAGPNLTEGHSFVYTPVTISGGKKRPTTIKPSPHRKISRSGITGA